VLEQVIPTMAATSQSKRDKMIWGLSLHGWEDVMRASLAIVGISGLFVGLATWFVVKLQRAEIAESRAEFDSYKLDAAKQIAAANAAGEAAKADAAQANARAIEAQLALEKYKAPRQINGPAFLAALAGKPKAPVEIVFVRDNPECWGLAMQIRDWLKEANWERSEPAAITGPDESRFATYPSAVQAGGQPTGVTIVLRAASQIDFERERIDLSDPTPPIDTPMKALSRALIGSLGAISQSINFETGTAGSLRVVVGPKP